MRTIKVDYQVLPRWLNILSTLILPWVPESVSVQIIERAKLPFFSVCLEVKTLLISEREQLVSDLEVAEALSTQSKLSGCWIRSTGNGSEMIYKRFLLLYFFFHPFIHLFNNYHKPTMKLFQPVIIQWLNVKTDYSQNMSNQ